jgi:adenine phosphoribosyltransferase
VFRVLIDAFVHRYMDPAMRPDVVAGLDARGFILGAVVAYELNVGFIPIRKKGKLPFTTVEETYELEYGSATVEMHTDAVKPGDRVVLRMDIEGAEYEVLRRLITSGAACSLDELHVETHARYAEGMHRFYLLDLVLDWLLQGCAAAGGGRTPRVFVSPMRLGLPPDSRRLVSPHVPGCAACPWVQEAAWGFIPRA